MTNRQDGLTPFSADPPKAYTSIAVFLLGAIALVVDSGYSVGAALLVAGGLYCCVASFRPRLDSRDYLILSVLLLFGFIGILDGVIHHEGARAFDRPSRFILAGFILVLVLKHPPHLKWLWAGLAMGGVLTASWACYQKFGLGLWRAGGYTHVIQFGNISMLTSLFCLAGLNWAQKQEQRNFWILFLLLGSMGGVLGSLLSGSRGGWIGLPLALFVLYRAYGDRLSSRLVIIISTLIVLGSFTAYNSPQLGVQQRVHSAINDIYKYQAGNSNTSVGARFEMWRGASLLFIAKPWFGWGSANYKTAMQDLAAKGKTSKIVTRFGHPHNELLNVAAKQGLLGVLALLALYLVPIRLFAPGLRAADLTQRSLATAGTLLPVAYIDFGLSQAFFVHNSGVMIYACWLLVLWGCYRHACAPNHNTVTAKPA